MIDIHTRFFHDLFQIPIGNRITEIKEDRKEDDLFRQGLAFDADRERGQG